MASTSQADEHELLERLREGDAGAFTTLYNRYWRKLFVAAANKLKDAAIAEELTQDVFADLWNRRQDLAIRKNLEAYLAVALKYRVIDLMAHEQHRRRYESQQAVAGASADDSTRQWLAYDELQHRLEQLVNRLPEKCRIVYSLKQDGHSQQEIAAKVGISTNTVENHLSKAYKLIREHLRYGVPYWKAHRWFLAGVVAVEIAAISVRNHPAGNHLLYNVFLPVEVAFVGGFLYRLLLPVTSLRFQQG